MMSMAMGGTTKTMFTKKTYMKTILVPQMLALKKDEDF